MAKTPGPDAKLRAEIERQVENLRSSMTEMRKGRDANRVFCQRHGAPFLTLSNFTSKASEYLISGLVQYVLQRDFAGATREFAAFADWFGYYDDILAAASRGELAALKPRFEMRSLLEATLCLVLADERACLARLSGPELEQLFVLPQNITQNKYGQAWAWFTYALLALARGAPSRELAAQNYPVRAKDTIEGYDLLLREALNGDRVAFETQRRQLEQAYPARGSGARSAVINWYGAGRIGQAMTFDVIGTVITCLAVRAGLDVEADSTLYPGAFIHRA
jgi:hypothetical protein